MQIGELDRRVTLQSSSRLANNYGEAELTWANYRTVWAKVDWDGGKVNEELEKITATSDVHIYIRNLDIEIDTTYRVSYDNKFYYIHAINEIDGREAFLELITKQKD